MTGRELATELMNRYADAHVLQKVGNDWVEVLGVQATGMHRNAVCLKVVEELSPGLPGVIVVDPEATPLNP